MIKLPLWLRIALDDVRGPSLLYDLWELTFVLWFMLRSTAKTTAGWWKETGQATSRRELIRPCGLGAGTSWDSGLSLVTAQSSMDSAGCSQLSCAQVILLMMHSSLFTSLCLSYRQWRNFQVSSACLSVFVCFHFVLQSWELLASPAASSQTSTLLTTPTATWWLRSTTPKRAGSWTTAETAYGPWWFDLWVEFLWGEKASSCFVMSSFACS